jgi:hypothetical protein
LLSEDLGLFAPSGRIQAEHVDGVRFCLVKEGKKKKGEGLLVLRF